MCVLFVGFRAHPDYDLVTALNRDELYARPTREARFWEDRPELFAGRDLQGGGTWFGITRSGRFAGITNFRDPAANREDARSRGEIPVEYLAGAGSPVAFLERLRGRAELYNGFNLIVGTPHEAAYLASGRGEVLPLKPGVYGLSNHFLDTPWPKLVRGKGMFSELLSKRPLPDSGAFLSLLRNADRAADADLPDTGVGLELERMLSPLWIESERYGTRSSSVVTVSKRGQVRFLEATYAPGTEPRLRESRFPLVHAPSAG